ncbi:MAG: hypothetical protein DI539_18985 [Flavobacterium psychrophilum]|nr:MAG: hypothetical protein DI539_18985 [Flavobacterium psychrophilum]
MDYAKDTNGAVAAAPKQKAKAAAPKRRRIPAEPWAQKGQRSNPCRPPAISTCGAAAYGFLKNRFLPHYTGQAVAGDSEKADFYRSFSLLYSHYLISPVDTQNLAYPYGREVALHEAARLLRDTHPQYIEIELLEDNGTFALHVTESYHTGNTLFYIPVLPVYHLLRNRKRKKAARLLLCVFHYLYHSVGVPYYRDGDSYLYWNYDMLADWVLDDPDGWDKEDFNSYANAVRVAKYVGNAVMRTFWNKIHNERYGQWLDTFVPNDAFDEYCLRIAQKFYRLRQDFPNENMYRHADTDQLPDPEEDYYDNDCITMEKYIGFVAATNGWLYNNLEQTINSEFGECSSQQEPVLKRCFDGQPQHTENLDFECRLFPLINELCYLLNNCDYGN